MGILLQALLSLLKGRSRKIWQIYCRKELTWKQWIKWMIQQTIRLVCKTGSKGTWLGSNITVLQWNVLSMLNWHPKLLTQFQNMSTRGNWPGCSFVMLRTKINAKCSLWLSDLRSTKSDRLWYYTSQIWSEEIPLGISKLSRFFQQSGTITATMLLPTLYISTPGSKELEIHQRGTFSKLLDRPHCLYIWQFMTLNTSKWGAFRTIENLESIRQQHTS